MFNIFGESNKTIIESSKSSFQAIKFKETGIDIGTRGGATGWTGVDMSTPLCLKTDFLIRLNSMKTGWGGGSFLAYHGSVLVSLRLQFSDQS